jgi:hypothetical protein
MKLLALFILFAAPAFAATWDQLPVVFLFDDSELILLRTNFAELHPWKIGNPLPASFKDAGLDAPVELVGCDMYLDGGSHYYLFRGANSKYLVLCTDSGSYGSSKSNKIITVDRPHLFLGAEHFTEKKKVIVPYDSACERFLLAAIKSEVERLKKLSWPARKGPRSPPNPTPNHVAPTAVQPSHNP